MADTSDPNRPPQERPNPSIESTRKDDEHDKAMLYELHPDLSGCLDEEVAQRYVPDEGKAVILPAGESAELEPMWCSTRWGTPSVRVTPSRSRLRRRG